MPRLSNSEFFFVWIPLTNYRKYYLTLAFNSFGKNMGKYVKNIKVAKNLPKSRLTNMDVLYLNMLHVDGNVNQKLQPSIFLGA